MKFWKTTLAVIVGVIIASIICSIFGLMMLGGIASIGSGASVPPSTGVLKIDMSTMTISEQSREANPMESLQGGSSKTQVGIWNAVQALNIAAEDPGVKYVYLLADGASGGYAELEEFRIALDNLRNKGKAVISYIENPSNAAYYLASVADKVYMTSCEGGMNEIVGLSTQIIFLKDLLDKLGVNVQLIRHGKYKSAGEMYIRNDISAENRLQYETLLGTIWDDMCIKIAISRGISIDGINECIDYLLLNSPEDFLNERLVDALYTREELQNQLATLYMVDKFSKVKFIDFPEYAAAKVTTNYRSKEKIAIVYADGEIIDGNDKKEVAGDRFASIIAKVRQDSSVKAVVFRVSSPGGSVLASEKIKNEIELLRECKPVIASYGAYAASGGYWISNSCDKIFSDATTLTGSIGVFSMIPEVSKTTKNLAHVNVVTIGTNAHSDMYSLMRPFDEDELEYMQESVEAIYDKFTSIVAEGRGLEVSYVDEIAQGRVWAGADALKIGLVDQIGTLEDAVHYAAEVAHGVNGSDLSSWQIVSYPKPLTLMDQVYEMVGMSKEELVFAGTPFAGVERAFRDFNETKAGQVYARMPYAITVE
ncbi:MAG: signal peptide peptidase SppA [Bacteroidales bacterium]|nr:signal peptide peptidase SppA [Bacteroidales bacterium]